MTLVRCGWAAAVLLLVASAFAADDKKPKDDDPRVRAEKPTVVTVEDTADPVALRETPAQQRSVPGRVARGVATGAAKAWNGLIDVTGKLLNVDQDVPADRERNGNSESDSKQKR